MAESVATKRELEQLKRALALVNRIHARRCKAESMDHDYGEDQDDYVAWPAACAEAQLNELIGGIEHAWVREESERKTAAFDTWLEHMRLNT